MNSSNTSINQNSSRSNVSDEDRDRIVSMTLDGYSVSYISTILAIKYQTVNSIVKRYLKTGLVSKSKCGGDRRSKLTPDMKQFLLDEVNRNCTVTLAQLKDLISEKYNITVSISTINRCLDEFHYTLKKITTVPERRNCHSTIQSRKIYADKFRNLEVETSDINLSFIDEVGFSVASRPSRGRAFRGQSAFLNVSAARTRNISVIAAMNRYGMIFNKIFDKALNGDDFRDAWKP